MDILPDAGDVTVTIHRDQNSPQSRAVEDYRANPDAEIRR